MLDLKPVLRNTSVKERFTVNVQTSEIIESVSPDRMVSSLDSNYSLGVHGVDVADPVQYT